MIVTVTLNPCVDETRWVSEFGAPSERSERQSGGKGVNVARVLSALGDECVAVAPYGGENGARFCELARAEGVNLEAVPMQGETRLVLTEARQRDMARRVTFGQAPDMTEAEAEALIARTLPLLSGCDALAVCGSACGGAAGEAGARLIREAQSRGVKTLLDSHGELLRLGCEACPDAVKPNLDELGELLGAPVSEDGAWDAAQALSHRLRASVLLSLGARGAILADGDTVTACPAPRVRAVNPVGSGDSFVAGWLHACLRGAKPQAALAYACATGAANAAMFPAARIRKEQVEAVLGFAESEVFT